MQYSNMEEQILTCLFLHAKQFCDFGPEESRLNHMPGSVVLFICVVVVLYLKWIMENFFSKLLSHFRTESFVQHFVFLCFVAVHGTSIISHLLQQTTKVHMYRVVFEDGNTSETCSHWSTFC